MRSRTLVRGTWVLGLCLCLAAAAHAEPQLICEEQPVAPGGDHSAADAMRMLFESPSLRLGVHGRMVTSRDVSGLGAGLHVVNLGERGYAPGIYVVRLRQGGSEITTRAVVVK